jgi:ribosomal protein L37AE/L43A
MKKYCRVCNKLVAQIEKGSRIRKGTIWICNKCASEFLESEKEKEYELKRDNVEEELKKIFFGGFNNE